MTPAERRINELIEKWLASIDLHLEYAELSDAAYARAQPWPKHDRPTRWVLEVARQKILELKAHVDARHAMGDGEFAQSLELMAFLANLVGVQHIQRFIPLAESAQHAAPRAHHAPIPPTITPPSQAAEPAPAETPRIHTPAPTPNAGSGPRASSPPTRPLPAADGPSTELKGKIMADAVRLIKWGKPWHELADLIARIADRPSAGEIRKVLRAHKVEIEKKVTEE
jgi:hypothetical protein